MVYMPEYMTSYNKIQIVFAELLRNSCFASNNGANHSQSQVFRKHGRISYLDSTKIITKGCGKKSLIDFKIELGFEM